MTGRGNRLKSLGLAGLLVGSLLAVTLLDSMSGVWAQEPGEAAKAIVVVRRPAETVEETISLDIKKGKAAEVIDLIATKSGRNIIYDGDPDLEVTIFLMNVSWHKALDFVLEQIHGVIEEETPELIRISTPMLIPGLELRDVPLKDVINAIAKIADANVIIDPVVVEKGGLVNVRLKNQPWTTALEMIVRRQGFMVVKEKGIYQVVSPDMLEGQLVTEPIMLKYILPPETYRPSITSEFVRGAGRTERRAAMMVAARATGAGAAPAAAAEFPLLAALKPSLSSKGEILYDYDRNILFVTDIEPKVREIKKLISQIDVEPPQVYVDVKFVTTKNPDVLDLGVLWPRDRTLDVGSAELMRARAARRPSYSLTHPGGEPWAFGILNFDELQAVLKFLHTDDSTKIKQAPKLTVLDNHEATIFVGEEVHYAESHASSSQVGTLEYDIREAAGSPVETGFQLLVVPHVVKGEDKVVITIIPEIEALTGEEKGFDKFTIGATSILLPRVSSRTVVTKMIVPDGQTAVIGGLVDDREVIKVTKVPLLGDIPGLGWLFKHKYTETNADHIFIFVTVKIIKSGPRMREIYTNYQAYDEILDPEKKMENLRKKQAGLLETLEGERPPLETGLQEIKEE